MRLAIFDLDNTLLAGDSDYLWGRFLVEQGLVDEELYERENQRFYDEYKAGQLDIFEFLAFSLQPLSQHSLDSLHSWHQQFMQEKIKPLFQQSAFDLLDKHREQGDYLLIITATNSFVTRPIAEALGVHDILATEPEMVDGRYTGKVSGTPTFQEGKVSRLNEWLKDKKLSLEDSYFYSDSHNDLPLLKLVTNPVAVDADEQLTSYAEDKNWPIISLRD